MHVNNEQRVKLLVNNILIHCIERDPVNDDGDSGIPREFVCRRRTYDLPIAGLCSAELRPKLSK